MKRITKRARGAAGLFDELVIDNFAGGGGASLGIERAMGLCLDCRHRDGWRYMSPMAAFNGGEGLHMIGPAPIRVHVCRSPCRLSGWEEWYSSPRLACTGKEVAS